MTIARDMQLRDEDRQAPTSTMGGYHMTTTTKTREKKREARGDERIRHYEPRKKSHATERDET